MKFERLVRVLAKVELLLNQERSSRLKRHKSLALVALLELCSREVFDEAYVCDNVSYA